MKAIVAMAQNRVIGREGKLPWHLPEDLKWFKKVTLGHGVLMGRKTFESIGKPLPGRVNFVVSRKEPPVTDPKLGESTQLVYIKDLAQFHPGDYDVDEIFVIGGAEIYQAFLPRCEELWITRIPKTVEGDTFFPPFEEEFELKEVLHKTPEFEVQRFVRKGY